MIPVQAQQTGHRFAQRPPHHRRTQSGRLRSRELPVRRRRRNVPQRFQEAPVDAGPQQIVRCVGRKIDLRHQLAGIAGVLRCVHVDQRLDHVRLVLQFDALRDDGIVHGQTAEQSIIDISWPSKPKQPTHTYRTVGCSCGYPCSILWSQRASFSEKSIGPLGSGSCLSSNSPQRWGFRATAAAVGVLRWFFAAASPCRRRF